jgi:GntR family transcriptional regulator/MocR family aminotransferase
MLLEPPPPALIQAAIAAFLEQGFLARHIRRMRELYAVRRAALVEALRKRLGPTLKIDLERGGMHLVARLPRASDDAELVARLTRQGISPVPLSACGVKVPYSPGLLIGFTNVDAKRAGEVARQLADAL